MTDRVNYTLIALRRSLGDSQEAYAERLGVSVRQVRNWESGRVHCPQRALLHRLHHLHGTTTAVELGFTDPSAVRVPRTADDGGGDVVQRRHLLAGIGGVSGLTALGLAPTASTAHLQGSGLAPLEAALTTTPPVPPGSTRQIHTALAAVRTAYRACRYRQAAAGLPDLIATANSTRDTATGRRRDTLSAVLTDAYVLASDLCIKGNEDALGWVYADRALAAARQTGDPRAVATASRAVAIAMRRAGHHDAATALLARTAAGLDRDHPADDTMLAAYGALLCTAAYASAQHHRRDQALTLIAEANRAARQLPPSGDPATGFGTAGVAVYRIGVYTALGEPGVGLDHARSVNPHLLPSAERRARWCIDTARAWEQYGDPQHAYEAILAAERAAPEEITRPSVRTLISNLLYSPHPTPRGLRDLAARAGAG